MVHEDLSIKANACVTTKDTYKGHLADKPRVHPYTPLFEGCHISKEE